MEANSVALHPERQNYISLYSGGGGLDLGFKTANPKARCILYVEREISASAILVDKIKRQELDDAPIYSDTGTLDCTHFAGKVDWVIAGFPCQPYSYASNQLKEKDERWLWEEPHIKRVLTEVEPRGIVLENVSGIFSGGLQTIMGDLASFGYDAQWTCIKASDVGSPQRRERVFCLADRRGEGRYVADSISKRGRGRNHKRKHAVDDFPAGPKASAKWRDILSRRPDLAPATLEYKVRRMADGAERGLARYQQLRIAGNLVIPEQANYALQVLAQRINA